MPAAHDYKGFVAREEAVAVSSCKASKAYRVPNLQLHLLVVDVDHAGAELDADGEVVDGLEALVGELKQEARLADACTANGSKGAYVTDNHCASAAAALAPRFPETSYVRARRMRAARASGHDCNACQL